MSVTTTRDGDVLIVTADNPPVNALGAAVRTGTRRRDRGSRGRSGGQGGGHPLRRQDLLRGRRHHRVRQADGRAFAADPRRPDRGARQAGDRRDPRHRAGRRLRGRARQPLPDRGLLGEAGAARGQARHPPRRGRHPAAAARRRGRTGAGNGEQGRSDLAPRRRRRRGSSTGSPARTRCWRTPSRSRARWRRSARSLAPARSRRRPTLRCSTPSARPTPSDFAGSKRRQRSSI